MALTAAWEFTENSYLRICRNPSELVSSQRRVNLFCLFFPSGSAWREKQTGTENTCIPAYPIDKEWELYQVKLYLLKTTLKVLVETEKGY